MEGKAAVYASTGTVLRVAKLWAAALVAAALVAVVMAEKADASLYGDWADSDGYVPVYSSCWAGYETGSYYWYYDGYAVYGTIYVNDCALDSLGAGPYDRQRVVDHEYGHAMGLPHSSDPYDYMYPVVPITGT